MREDREPAAARRKRSDATFNHAALLGAARRLLAEDGSATMAEIAKAAGVGRGTAYRHFPTRERLIEAVRRQSRDDVTANEDDHLRAAGEVSGLAPSPLSVPDVLNKVPPFQLGMQIVAEAQRLDGVSAAAIYLVDLDGTSMQRLAGAESFPSRLAVELQQLLPQRCLHPQPHPLQHQHLRQHPLPLPLPVPHLHPPRLQHLLRQWQ